jgi:hypothetical protein
MSAPMMNEPKPFASLSSTLLARKGHAKPAMRPQGFAGFGMTPQQQPHDDLGWNDMGFDAVGRDPEPVAQQVPVAKQTADIVPILPETPLVDETVVVETPAVIRQQENLVRELTPLALEAVRKIRAAPGSKGKAAFTLRLDPERHLKLRLICAVTHRSAQAIVVEALDTYLNTQSAVAALATAKTPR